MLLVILSSLSYAVYIVGVNHSTLKLMSTARLTFYALLFGLSIYICLLYTSQAGQYFVLEFTVYRICGRYIHASFGSQLCIIPDVPSR